MPVERVLLIQPEPSERLIGFTNLARVEPLALEMVAAAIDDIVDVKILDLRGDQDVVGWLTSYQPDLVGITGYTADVPRMKQLFQMVKDYSQDIVTVAGGHHASVSPQFFFLPTVDYIVVGEGELTFREMIEELNGERRMAQVAGIYYKEGGEFRWTGDRRLIRNIDELPDPRRDLVDQWRDKVYFFRYWLSPYVVETSRGCPYRCNFCSVWTFYDGRYRIKSPERVVEEIEKIPSRYVCFVDDNFTHNLRRAEKIAELLLERGIKKRYWAQVRSDSIVHRPDVFQKWAQAGMDTVLVGFESIDQKYLDQINKSNTVENNDQAIEILHDAGIRIWGTFLIMPDWDERDFAALTEYVNRNRIEFPQFTILTPLPGTDYWEEMKDKVITTNWEEYDYLHSVLPFTKLSPEAFYKQVADLYRNTGMTFSQIKEAIRSGEIPKEALPRLRQIGGMLAQLADVRSYLKGTIFDPGQKSQALSHA
jgi:radical SAM superfamily enzyme YgiQ (UPF0313 family)